MPRMKYRSLLWLSCRDRVVATYGQARDLDLHHFPWLQNLFRLLKRRWILKSNTFRLPCHGPRQHETSNPSRLHLQSDLFRFPAGLRPRFSYFFSWEKTFLLPKEKGKERKTNPFLNLFFRFL